MILRLTTLCLSLTILAGCVPSPADPPATTQDSEEVSADAKPEDSDSGESDTEAKPGSEADLTEKLQGKSESGSDTPDEKPETKPEGEEEKPGSETEESLEEPEAALKPTKLPPEIFKSKGLTPLNPNNTVFLDLPNKRLLLKTQVCLDRGMLEMLLCLKQTKEHESIVTIDAKAFTIHTGLLALGCESGKPATYEPKFQPASGQKIDIFMHFTDPDGKLQRVPATKWIRKSRFRYYEEEFDKLPEGLKLNTDGNLRWDDMNRLMFWYGPMTEKQRDECLAMHKDEKFQKAIKRFYKESQPKEMKSDWIFVGSGFFELDGERRYKAEGGYVVCVANFGQAMIDVSVSSSADGQETLVFEAWQERLPPLGSEVMVELVPQPKEKKGRADKPRQKNLNQKQAIEIAASPASSSIRVGIHSLIHDTLMPPGAKDVQR